ncbi:site-specific integrase [Bombilactobacillus bombi]|uniref:Site-specific integrase n=1 Tax=Bombilactobacillus bombi TaxID=1303590 RepID=A0A3R6UW11_9LACO|nr:site-specific integrase [Bombilactobacillus bombi]RHW48273.1 site-specific integrase [Bombilactobacillus bombi]
MATFVKKGKKWMARISYKDANGKYQRENKGGFATKKEAQLYANEFEIRAANGPLSASGKLNLPDYFWNWYKTYKEPNITDRTQRTYIHAYHVLQKYFSNYPIENITRPEYQKFLSDFGSNHSKATISKINSLVHACVKSALYDGAVKKDFIQNTTLVFDRDRTQTIEYLNMKDLHKLVNYLESSLNCHFTSKYMILLAIYTGMRLGEIQGLKWSDINFQFNTITVNRSWHEGLKQFKEPKNESSKRVIRVNSSILEILKQLKHDDKNQQIFLDQYQTVPTSSAVNKTLKQSLKQADINRKGFHFHSLRHTHVAFLLYKKIDLYIISKRLGHKDMTTTIRVYSYLIDEYQTRANAEIENILNDLETPIKSQSADIN